MKDPNCPGRNQDIASVQQPDQGNSQGQANGTQEHTLRPVNPNATRDHLANERTFLAWVRSCIAIVALGFVVARFGLVIRELGQNAPPHSSIFLSTAIGVILVVSGAGLIVLATMRYRATTQAIDDNSFKPSESLLLLLAGGFVFVSVLLAIYLVVTM